MILDDTLNAKQNFTKAIELISDSVDVSTACWALAENAKFYYGISDMNRSLDYAHKAEKLEPSKSGFLYGTILQILSKSYLKIGNYKQSAMYYSQYETIREDLNIEEKAINIGRLKIEYDYQIKEQQIEIENNKRKIKIVSTISGLIVLLLVLLIIIIRYKNRLVKAKLEYQLKELKENELRREIEFKNKELATKTIKETEQIELINLVQENLKDIQSKVDLPDTRKALSNLRQRIRSNSSQSNWEEFELRFSNVYESFYRKLDNLHPYLTHNDKRICALIRLNLSTKDISHLTKTSIKSVENARTRLRKKLGLTNRKIELVDYLTDL